MRRSRNWGVVLLAGVLSIAASCGGDDSGGSSNGGEASTGSVVSGASTKTPTIFANSGSDPWIMTPWKMDMKIGDSGVFECPGGGQAETVWGVGTYTDDSSICTAAVFEGRITIDDGGIIEFKVTEGLEAYEGGEANGIVTQAYDSWGASFVFVD